MVALLATGCVTAQTETEVAAPRAETTLASGWPVPAAPPGTPVPTTGTGQAETTTTQVPDLRCEVAAVPPSAGLDPFYEQGCDLDGFWVVSAAVVDPDVLEAAGELAIAFFEHDPDLAAQMQASGVRLGVIGEHQQPTDMPEYRDLNEAFPETNWDERGRGYGATVERPLVSGAEENITCDPTDRWFGEDILLHEFSHTVHQFGLAVIDPDFEQELTSAYENAIEYELWTGSYAETNSIEYWAEMVQIYFGRNFDVWPTGGVEPADSRADLERWDPQMFALIDRHLSGLVLPESCHDSDR